MSVSATKMTARQFLQLGPDPAGVRLELVKGEIAVSPSPTPRHSRAVHQLAHLIESYLDTHDVGELLPDLDTIFGEYDVRRPDILFFFKSRLHLITDKHLDGPPDLAVEVLSPSSIKTDRQAKFVQYALGNIPYYWIVDPDHRTIEAYSLDRSDYRLVARGSESDVVHLPPFPDLPIPLSRLWRRKH